MLKLFIFLYFFCEVFANPSCPPGTKPSTTDPNTCFLFGQTPKSFDNAEADCVAAGGHLVPVFDQFTNLLVTLDANEALKNSTDFWIGGKLTNVTSTSIWLWTWHKSLLEYADWASGEPNKNHNSNCISVNIGTASWKSTDCNVTKSYVCRISPEVYICEDGWTFLEETQMCYKMFANSSPVNFTKASKMCQNENAKIISIHNSAENTLLGKLTTLGSKQNTGLVGVWIGLFYMNGNWTWTDGTPYDYQNWGENDPDYVGSSNCVVFYPDGATGGDYSTYIMQWDTLSCSNLFPRVVCKKSPTIVPISEKP